VDEDFDIDGIINGVNQQNTTALAVQGELFAVLLNKQIITPDEFEQSLARVEFHLEAGLDHPSLSVTDAESIRQSTGFLREYVAWRLRWDYDFRKRT